MQLAKHMLGIGLLAFATMNIQEANAFCEGHTFAARDAAIQLATLNSYLMKKDFDRFKRSSAELEANLPCMRTPAPPLVFATAYRYIGIGHYLRGDQSTAERWFRSAFELDPNHEWGVDEVSSTEPLYGVYESQRSAGAQAPIPVQGMQLQAPAGTVFYLDGRVWTKAEATPDRPHILFVAAASDQHIISRFLIDGNLYPQQFVVPAQDVAKSKKKKKTDDSVENMFAVTEVKRVRPPSKTPLLVSSAATLVIASGVYGYTFTTNKQFFESRSTTEKDSLRSKNNSLIVTSIVVGTLGLGVGYAGVIVDYSPMSLGIPWAF